MLAIVIPFYKLYFFESTLQSLVSQTDQRFNVYIGDDCSPDDCSFMLDRYKEKINIKYKRFDTNLGSIFLTQQWTRCIELSDNEDWIMILGDDDILESNVVEEFYRQYCAFEFKSNVVRFASVILNKENDVISKKFENEKWEDAYKSYYRKFENLSRSSLSEHIFSREIYKKKGFVNYPLAWFSDDKAWLDFSENKLIYSINEATVHIRNSDLNISGKTDNVNEKKKAAIAFYRNLLDIKPKVYSRKQRIKIIQEYEYNLRAINQLKLKEWNLILAYYIRDFNFYAFKKFLKRSFIRIFK